MDIPIVVYSIVAKLWGCFHLGHWKQGSGSETPGLWVMGIFTYSRYQQESCINLHFYQQFVRVRIAPYPHTTCIIRLLFFQYNKIQYLIEVLVFPFLFSNEIEYIYLYPIYLSSFMKFLLRSLTNKEGTRVLVSQVDKVFT